MFDGPWGGFLGLIVFIFLTYLGLKHEQKNKSTGEKEREMKVCSHCGKAVDKKWSMCPYCSKKV